MSVRPVCSGEVPKDPWEQESIFVGAAGGDNWSGHNLPPLSKEELRRLEEIHKEMEELRKWMALHPSPRQVSPPKEAPPALGKCHVQDPIDDFLGPIEWDRLLKGQR